MSDRLTIGELAKAADVPASTVRYYERTGLLRRPPRSASNYRLYGEEDVYRVRFVRAARHRVDMAAQRGSFEPAARPRAPRPHISLEGAQFCGS